MTELNISETTVLMYNISEDLGSIVRRVRSNKKMTQDELAILLGLSRTQLNSLETGRYRYVDDRLITLLCFNLDVRKDFLAGNWEYNRVSETEALDNPEALVLDSDYLSKKAIAFCAQRAEVLESFNQMFCSI